MPAPWADQGRVPDLFVQPDGVLPWITMLPFIQDRQVAPGQALPDGSEPVAEKSLQGRYESLVNSEAKVCAQPGINRDAVGTDTLFIREPRALAIERAFQYGLAQGEHE